MSFPRTVPVNSFRKFLQTCILGAAVAAAATPAIATDYAFEIPYKFDKVNADTWQKPCSGS